MKEGLYSLNIGRELHANEVTTEIVFEGIVPYHKKYLVLSLIKPNYTLLGTLLIV